MTSSYSIVSLIKQTLAGKSILRAMMNDGFRDVPLRGAVLDLGSGEKASYFDFFNMAQVTRVDQLDNFRGSQAQRVDLEQPPKKVTARYQTVLCCNLLEHLFHPQNCLAFAYQSLLPAGKLHGFVPFLIRVHPDPHDFHRYTSESLERMLAQAGFKKIRVSFVGAGPFIASWNTVFDLAPAVLQVLPMLLALSLDRVLLMLAPSRREIFPLGYIFEASKAV